MERNLELHGSSDGSSLHRTRECKLCCERSDDLGCECKYDRADHGVFAHAELPARTLGVGNRVIGLGCTALRGKPEFSWETIDSTSLNSAVAHFVPGIMRRWQFLYANWRHTAWYLQSASDRRLRRYQSIRNAQLDRAINRDGQSDAVKVEDGLKTNVRP